jgi:hypothetical protein
MAVTTSIPVMKPNTSEVAYRMAAEVSDWLISHIVEISPRARRPKRCS